MMKRMLATFAATVSGLVVLLGMKAAHSHTPGLASATGATGPSTSGNSSSPSSPSAHASAGPSASPKTQGNQATRTVTGNSVRTLYGDVEVQVTFSGSRITAVKPLRLPHSNGIDMAIDQQVVPILIQETLQAQGANINMISGATYTSTGYVRSLQSALDKAKS